MKLHYKVLIAIALAAIVGSITDKDTVILSISLYKVHTFLGTLFLNALKMVVVPLVCSSIICGVVNMTGNNRLGILGGKTIGYYLVSCSIAVVLGLVAMNIFQPGNLDKSLIVANTADHEAQMQQLIEKVKDRDTGDIVDVFLRMVPPNVMGAAHEGQMLGLIFFSILFGYFMSQIGREKSQLLFSFWEGVFDTMLKLTLWVMKFAPIGIYALVAKNVSVTGFSTFASVFQFFLVVSSTLILHSVFTLAFSVKLLAGISPMQHIKAMAAPIITAFSTASSSATIPITLKAMQNVNVSNKISSFIVPLGATVNMNGTALYECMAALFIAQCYGIDLSVATQILIVITSLMTSIGVAGIPAGSLVAISVILGVAGLPLEGLGLLLITDRILDMMRTAVNVFGDTCAAVIVAKSEDEEVYK